MVDPVEGLGVGAGVGVGVGVEAAAESHLQAALVPEYLAGSVFNQDHLQWLRSVQPIWGQ